MQKRKFFNLAALILGLFLFGACEYATIMPEPPGPPPPPPPPGDSTSFSLKVQPIFNDDCIICHQGSTPPDLRSGKSYSSLFDKGMVVASNPEASLLYTCLQPGGSMSQYGNATSNATIYNWIKEGAKNN
jgi:hypothetical protein